MPNIGIWGLSQTGSSVSSGTIFYYPFFPFFPFLKAPPLLPTYQGIVWAPDLPFRFTHVFIYPNVLFPSCIQSPTVITLPLFVPQKSPSAVQSSSHTISPWTFLLFLSSHQILPNTVFLMPQYPRLGAPPSLFLPLNPEHPKGRNAVCYLFPPVMGTVLGADEAR